MSSPFVGEIRMFAGTYAPRNWALCQGQTMSIAQNTALFSLLGTQYGGDGRSTFGLPNLQGNAPVDQGTGAGLSQYVIGQIGGEANHTLSTTEMPGHTHPFNGDSIAVGTKQPAGNYFGGGTRQQKNYGASSSPTLMAANIVQPNTGGGQPHPNQQPYLVLVFIIALTGIFPVRS